MNANVYLSLFSNLLCSGSNKCFFLCESEAAATSVFLCESEAAATATAIVTPRSKLILRFAFQAVMGKWQIRDIERVRLE
jgi:hypothetical protein